MSKSKKRIISLALVLMVFLPVFGLPAMATTSEATIDLNDIPAGSTSGTGWSYTADSPSYFTIEAGANVTITGSISDDTYIKVAAGESTITLDGASITTDLANTSPIELLSGADLSLNLSSASSLTASNNDSAGLCVPVGSEVTIAGSGSLEARGGWQGAGIGGAKASSGAITINGGSIDAYGGSHSAGIGRGYRGTNGAITINNSGTDVRAYGGDGGAGIGTGNGSRDGGAGNITINDATVIANGGNYSAGIGGGNKSDGGSVVINHGTVTASGGNNDLNYTPPADIGAGGYELAPRLGGTLEASNGSVVELTRYGTNAIYTFENSTIIGAGAIAQGIAVAPATPTPSATATVTPAPTSTPLYGPPTLIPTRLLLLQHQR